MDFKQPYNPKEFITFLNNFLPDDFQQIAEPININDLSFKPDKIKKVKLIGNVPSLKNLCVYEIEHESESDPRVTLSRETFRLMSNYGVRKALAVFYSKNSHNYRFSLATIELKLEGSRVIKDYSNPRRYSFFLGPDAKTHTPTKYLITNGRIRDLNDLQNRFSVEVVTKEFFGELSNWYFWALKEIECPKDVEKEPNGKNIWTIRLITRLIFIWFMKQKKLIPENLFKKDKVSEMLKDISDSETTYYKAIFQNLFFATLNTPTDERRFRSNIRGHKGYNPDYGNKSVYRYHEIFKDPDKMEDYFGNIPFLNGGLFECLDNKEEGISIDGFSRTKKNQPEVPNKLFFSDEHFEDLNKDYGTKNKKYKVRGLIDLLQTYNFTIDESTPVDVEIALDPELLGRVFENLLASYNPETATTARKATGSYYTPREIVDYMVTQSIKEYFKTKLSERDRHCDPDVKSGEAISSPLSLRAEGEAISKNIELDKKLNNLLSYDSDENPFNENETDTLINSINALKIIDPAVGSGAFPMGILQKLVFVLSKLKKIEENFKKNELDYGRKLYLIQNCIYGVDIQPIAIQIAKLRFFISLLVDEKVEKPCSVIASDQRKRGNLTYNVGQHHNEQGNYGIEPLPNLELKFISANSLIGLNLKGQLVLKDLRLPELEEDLKRVRGIYFRTSDTEEKKEIRKEDKKIRNKISSLLKESGFPSEDTKKIAEWDPYNSNKSADWFDPEWMFGIKSPSPLAREGWDEGGFDIVIGNPPYVRIYRNNIEEKFLEYLKKSYVSAFKKFDLYVIFIEKGISLLNKNGFISFIVPDKWLTQPYGQMIRNLILTNCNILLLMDLTAIKVFESSTVDNFVFLFKKEISEILNKHNKIKIIKTNDIFKINNLVTNEIEQSTFKKNTPFLININQKSEKGLIKKIEDNSISLQKICYVNWGCRPTPKEKYVSNYKINEKYKPLIVGSNISKYRISTNYRWVKYVRDMYNPMFKELFENITIVFKDIIGKGNLTAALNIMNYYADFTVINAIKWKNVANLKLRQIKVFQDYKKYDFYDVKFILGIVNSRLESFYFNKTMRSGLHTLPNNVKNLLVPVIAETGQKNIINLVDTILSIHEQYGCPLSDGASAKVKECEHQIDQLVYKLYDLTEEEIKIVKSSTEKYK